MKIAVVGGGIAGLSAALELSGRAEVTVFEADRLGGRIQTEPFEGRPVDCGPDAFITRSPDALGLCEELGLDDLVAPRAGRAMLWWNGALKEIPEGLMLGAPSRIGPLIRSGLLSPVGIIRAGADVVLPRRRYDGDVSVRDLIAGRFGAEVADRLADPLIGSIHAGRSEHLSAEATVPQLLGAARRSRSLLLELRKTPQARSGAPLFMAPRLGMSELVSALERRLRQDGVVFEAARVGRVGSAGGASVDVDGSRFDGCILAVGAAQAASILGDEVGAGLSGFETASVALVTLGYPQLDLPDGCSGLLVPRQGEHLMTACSFASQKWPHWAAPGRTVLRVSAGRAGDRRIDRLSDEELVERLSSEVASAVGAPVAADTWRVSRWPDAFPQYGVNHTARVERAERDVRTKLPGAALCGSSYRGIGIPACIASGRAAARSLRPLSD